MKNTFKYNILFLLLLCRCIFLSAQSYTFRNIVMSDGLSGLLVNTIYKDTDGFIWLGTDNGLDRFDGVRIRQFEFHGVENVVKKRVAGIVETADKHLWVGNGVGLWKMNEEKRELERMFSEKIDFPVNALLADGNTLYIGTDKGLFIQKEGNLEQIPVDKNLLAAGNRILDICLSEDHARLWLATMQGLASCNLKDGAVSCWHFRENVPEADYFRCITRIGTTLYLGTMTQGVVRFDIPTSTFSHASSLGCNVISDISSDGKDLIYVATDGNGVHYLSHKKQTVVRSFCHNIHQREGIRSNSIYSLLVDERGSLWVGHFQAGLDYSLYENGLFQTYAFPPLFDSSNFSVRSFLIRGNEKLIGTRDGLFYIDEAAGIVKSFVKPELNSDLILSLCFYEGEYYVGTYGGGMMVLNPANLTLRYFTEGDDELFHKGHVFCIKPDVNNNLWLGTSQGVYCYNQQTGHLKKYDSRNSQLPEGNVYEITFDSSGKGWIATETGLCIYDPASQSLRTNVFPEGFAHKDKIRAIYENSSHSLYFLREKGSLFTSTLTMDRFENVSPFSIMPDNSIMSIVEDNQQRLWLGCSGGLVRLKKGQESYDVFTSNDGLPGPTFTSGAAYRDEKGMVWFGNTKGLIYADSKQADEVKNNARPLKITDVVANGSSISDSSLKHDQNNITFCFTDFSYGLPSAMLYEYRMDGVDEDWKLLTAQSEVSYYGLSSGNYTFHVRLLDNAPSEATYQLFIRPMIAWWAWILILVSVVLAVFLIRYYIWKWVLRFIPSVSLQEKKQDEKEQTTELPSPEIRPSEEKYKTNRMADSECKELYAKLAAYMKTERPFTNPDLKMGDLASALETSSHSLSYLLNQYLKQSYYDFINEYRIAEFKKLVVDSQYSRYTLTALAELCGFSSRASFFRSFKKSSGVTPNEYIRSVGGTAKEE